MTSPYRTPWIDPNPEAAPPRKRRTGYVWNYQTPAELAQMSNVARIELARLMVRMVVEELGRRR